MSASPRLRVHHRGNVDRLPAYGKLTPDQRTAIQVVSRVLPFRLNDYVVDELIDWSAVPDDPIFQLTVPQERMLDPSDFAAMRSLIEADAPENAVSALARQIQRRMNPHPGHQLTHNVPYLDGRRLEGLQHKYRETVLYFPAEGQTCHAYCAYCFRWAQFSDLLDVRFASRRVDDLVAYLQMHPEVTDVLLTGGDPLVMRAAVLRRYVEPLLSLRHVSTIRIGTKAPAYWPHRFVGDRDADDLLRLFEEVVARRRHLTLMVHYSHPRELETPIARAALRRLASTGAVIRCQAPLARRVNDDPATWAVLWRHQVAFGAVPYYMFVERDTGPQDYYKVPLERALRIFRDAYAQVSGLARTVRGPVMSTSWGKLQVEGTTIVADIRALVLKVVQARDPSMVGRILLARHDDRAAWIDELEPLGEPWPFTTTEPSHPPGAAPRIASAAR